MKTLPEWIYFNGKTYYFIEWQVQEEILNGWWFCGYWPDGNRDEMPAETPYYFLISSNPFSKEKAEKDLLEKINEMTPWKN